MYYIRTGDKVTKPFTINIWHKLLLLVFVVYFFFITATYFENLAREKLLRELENSTANKYALSKEYENLIDDISDSTRNLELIERSLDNEKRPN